MTPDEAIETRDFLLASLDDLEREYAAGDVDDDDYRVLKDDYTARAAAAIRVIEGATDRSVSPEPASSSASGVGRRVAAVVVVGFLAIGAGLAVVASSGDRGSGGLTGLDVASATNRVNGCIEQEAADQDAALECYDDVLDDAPDNPLALTYRGWLQVRSYELDDGIADLDAAIRFDPTRGEAYLFRAIANSRRGEAIDAVADLAAFYRTDPSDEERRLAERFAGDLATEARDVCIAADTAGGDPVTVLACYRDVLAVLDDDPVTLAYQGWLLVRGQQLDDGLAMLDRAIDAAPELSAAYVFRAAGRIEAGDLGGAEADLDAFDALGVTDDSERIAALQVRARLEQARQD